MNGKQLTVRGMVIGAIGSVIITCSSMFIALKLSSLPWPIMFVALFSMVCLKALGNTNLSEINVTHTAMSAGAMVAGGVAFTIPGIFILNPSAEISLVQLLVIALGGTALGLIFTALMRKYFIETQELPYAMGQAAADLLEVGDKGGKKSVLLFTSFGIAGLFAVLRDWFTKIPQTWFSKGMMKYGSIGGFYISPMLVAIGYIVGPLFIGVWFLGAVVGDFGILIFGQKFGFFTLQQATDIKQSLGLGMMVGTGIGILIKGILPNLKKIFGAMFSKENTGDSILPMRWAPIFLVLLVFVLTYVCNLGIIASVITIIGVWLTTSMSSQCVGQSGINPMEIFGIFVLLVVKTISSIGQNEALFVAAIVAIACGLTGDVMNDFKAGHILKTNAKAQWIAEVIGGFIGAVVSVFVFYFMLKAYGGNAFNDGTFAAAQAHAVSAMIKGISNYPVFMFGLAAAAILYCLKLPVMTFGLGVYLPFYLSATAFIGGALRFIVDKFLPNFEKESKGQIIASGVLGGEGVVGVVIAIIVAVKAIA